MVYVDKNWLSRKAKEIETKSFVGMVDQWHEFLCRAASIHASFAITPTPWKSTMMCIK